MDRGDDDADRPVVEIWRGFDPIFARVAADALCADGIPARVVGLENPAAIGFGQYAFAVSVDVPEADAARAKGLIATLAGASELATESRAWPPPHSPEIKPKDRRATALIGGLLVPGMDQILMYRGYAGLCIILGICLSMVPSVIMRSPLYLGLTILFSIPVDTAAGQLAASAFARSERMPARRQLLLGAGELVIVQVAVAITAYALGAFG